ncbi:unnamed protein product, partial [Effrenium voratum]
NASTCSTPSECRKQSWAELSEDLLTDSEPWEAVSYTESQVSQSPQVPEKEPEMSLRCPQQQFSVAYPVVDIAGLPKALCNTVCVEAMLQQAGLSNSVCGFTSDETSSIRVMLSSWPAAVHCQTHFEKSSWAGGALKISVCLAIPQVQQDNNYMNMNYYAQFNNMGQQINQFDCGYAQMVR